MVNTKVTAVTVAALAAVAACEPIGYPVVETSLGKLRGVTESYEGTVLHAYRGIRYTNAPVNERRFLRSELYNESWTGILNATGYGPVCIQNPAAVSWLRQQLSAISVCVELCMRDVHM